MFEQMKKKLQATDMRLDWNGIRFSFLFFVIGVIIGVLL